MALLPKIIQWALSQRGGGGGGYSRGGGGYSRGGGGYSRGRGGYGREPKPKMTEDQETAKYWEDNLRKGILKDYTAALSGGDDEFAKMFRPNSNGPLTYGQVLDMYKSGQFGDIIKGLGGN